MKGYPVKEKFLIVTRAIPPQKGGTMTIIHNLLATFTKDEVLLLGWPPVSAREEAKTEIPEYPCYSIFSPPPSKIYAFAKFLRLISFLAGIIQGLRILFRRRIKIVVGVYPELRSLLLSFILAKMTGRKYLVYFCDLYAENQTRHGKTYRKFAIWLQTKIFKKAEKIMAVNTAMKDFYDKTYGIDSFLLPTILHGGLPASFSLPAPGKPFVLAYSGSLIRDRFDPMLALWTVIRDDPNFELRLLTHQTAEHLKSWGFSGRNLKVKFCPSHQILLNELSACHAFYLPLTFKTDYNSKEQLATCFGAKTYEYFQACRPVIVHCPPEYFTSVFFAKNQCGILIHTPNQDEIRKTLEKLRAEYATLAPQLVRNALTAARQFEGGKIAKSFTDLLNSLS